MKGTWTAIVGSSCVWIKHGTIDTNTIPINYLTDADNTRITKNKDKVTVGSKLDLRCSSRGVPQWFRFKNPIQPRANSRVLKFSSLRLEDAGTYFCHGVHPWSNKRFLAATTISVIRESPNTETPLLLLMFVCVFI